MAKNVLRRTPSRLRGIDLTKKVMGGASQLVADDFFEPSGGPPTYYGILKRWTGAAWTKAKLMVYSGGTWVAKPLKRWTGSSWVEVDASGRGVA
jgi:hypothetical protein